MEQLLVLSFYPRPNDKHNFESCAPGAENAAQHFYVVLRWEFKREESIMNNKKKKETTLSTMLSIKS